MLIGDAFIQTGLIYGRMQHWTFPYLLDPNDVQLLKCSISESLVPKNSATAVFHNFMKKLTGAKSNDEINELLDQPENLERVNASQWDFLQVVNVDNRCDLVN